MKGLLQYIQSKISLRRLERYLDLPELEKYVQDELTAEVKSTHRSPGSVIVDRGSFSWTDPDAEPVRPIQENKPKKQSKKGADKDSKLGSSNHSVASSHTSEGSVKSQTITLQDLSFSLEAGSLTAVVGSVGSGKSSFLAALMGEMEPIGDSKVYLPKPPGAGSGFISYCAQTPWVVNDTLRGNIIFGREYDEERFERVLEACALVDDLAVLPAGDLTEIGERGINLSGERINFLFYITNHFVSGGQKARVSLARALYSDESKLLFLDDPLSAVDAHVGEHIFSKAIVGKIAKGKTRVLVTHHVHLLSRCDSVIVLENGRIKHHGKFDNLVSQGVSFAGAVDVHNNQATATRGKGKGKAPKVKDAELTVEAKAKLKQSGKTLVKEEEREEGSVASSAYTHYARVGGILVAVATFVIQGVGRACEVLAGFWLAHWAERSLSSNEPFSKGTTTYYVGIYASFGLAGVLGLTLRAVLIAVHRLRASKQLHDDLTERILRAPVAFFDITPIGRVLNRFAADMDKVDLELTQSLSQGMSTIFNVVGAIGAMVAATKGVFLVPMLPISYLYYKIQKWFRKTSTELQRINSIANSPIFADFSQVLSGTSTIRAYGEEQRFFRQCQSSFDAMNASYILVQLTNYWLSLRLDVLGGFMGAFIGGVAVATSSYGFISPGWLGLALTYSIEVTAYLKHGVRMVATIEAQMNSVERILFYTQNVQSESPEILDDDPPKEWPQSGEIEIRNASMRYRDGPLVLKDVSLRINAGEKIGICGRTGSGKSSLMVALFRISELEDDGGAILIDGVDIKAVGTSTLRLNLSIIPQDPVIFSNTVRYNLDPFEECSDDELWEVLEKVQLTEVISSLPNGLLAEVAEGGDNFSQGQRQLLCIARALLRKSKILVLDEATASIDNTTDATIQKMIRENFQDATVLTIAHRLNTILDSDRVLVLDDGRVAEFESPDNLMRDENSLFKIMVEKSREAKGE